MPIIEIVPIDTPLSQGDILQDINLFSTKESWLSGGESIIANKQLCLVVSRPCVASHKHAVTVVAVEQIKNSIPGDVKTFDNALAFFKDVRDGSDSPDVFYIGDIPDKKGRYAARLDSFHSVQVPTDGTIREEFLRTKRIGRLCNDFARDLHLRIFRAFASLGFDDISWFATQDLAIILQKGKSEILAAEQDLSEKQTAKLSKEFEAKSIPDTAIQQAETKVRELKEKLAPFEAEFSKRNV